MKQLINKNQWIKEYKKWIPNVLTGIRIILTPIIIFLGVNKKIPIVIVLVIVATVTDFLDGRLARIWNTVSNLGSKLDAVADKIFAIGMSLSLTSIFPSLWIVVILEVIIAISNLIFHYKSHRTESLWIGKIKTTSLFLTILFVICLHFFPILTTITRGLITVCINLQILCILEYALNFYDHMHPITVEENLMHQQIMSQTENSEENTIVIENLQELVTQYENKSDT